MNRAAGGGRAGMKVHIAYGYGLFTGGGMGANYGAEAGGDANRSFPWLGGQTKKGSAVDSGDSRRDHHGDAELHGSPFSMS